MSRRFVTRAVVAPIVIAIATSAVPPAGPNYSEVDEWVNETLPATLASLHPTALRAALDRQLLQASTDVEQLRTNLNKRVLEGAADIVRVRVEFTTRLSAATDFIASETDAMFARLDGWMTSASPTGTAALPAAPAEIPSLAIAFAEIPSQAVEAPPSRIASVSLVAPAPVAPPPAARVKIDQRGAQAPAQKPIPVESAAIVPKPPAPPQERAQPVPEVKELKKASTPAPTEKAAEKTVLASLGISAVANAATAPAAPVAVAPPAAPPAAELKAVREEKLIPATEVKAAREDKPEEKQIFASLGRQATAIDTHPVPATRPAPVEAKAAPAPEPAPAEFEDRHINNGGADMPPDSQIANVPISSPLKLRALTRADIPPPEKFASLGSTARSDTRNLPPEQQRVAYDAPVVIEQPKSIGRRKWIDEANKYQGLGSPEALLEALKHMGAGAKTLGLPASLWCADFMNLVLRKSGIKATGSRAARSYLEYGQKINEPRVGAIAIFSRGKNGGHIGIVRGTDGNGNPIIVSGNHNNKVAEATYPKARVLAYVVPK